MNYRIVLKLLGLILIMLALAMGACWIVAFVDSLRGLDDHDAPALGWGVLITLLAGCTALAIGWKGRPDEVLRKEAIAVVGLSWIVAALFGSIPFILCEEPLSPAAAVFESMSGFTTTGSTAIVDLSVYPTSMVLWRSLTQWIGGLGILALFVALLTTFGVSGKSLMGRETSMNLSESPTTRIKDLTTRLWIFYGALTLVCILGLWIIGLVIPDVDVTIFDAVLHALTVVSTAGFSPYNSSIGHFNSLTIEIFLCLFMIVSSLNLILIVNIFSGGFKRATGKEEARLFLIILGVAIVLVTLNLRLSGHSESGGGALREAFFPVLALGSSTGYGNGVDWDTWPMFSQWVLMILMVFGGCAGSTAGGIKLHRVLLAARIIRHEVTHLFRPQQVFRTSLDGQQIDRDGQMQLMCYLGLVAAIMLTSMAVISLIEPSIADMNTAFGAVIATFLNMGPGFGDVGPTNNFGHFGEGSLLFLSLLMLLGRLEILVVVALFSRTLWRRY